MHNVDEDQATISNQGSWWYAESQAGITFREVSHNSSRTADDVASSNTKNSQIIRMLMMSTKA